MVHLSASCSAITIWNNTFSNNNNTAFHQNETSVANNQTHLLAKQCDTRNLIKVYSTQRENLWWLHSRKFLIISLGALLTLFSSIIWMRRQAKSDRKQLNRISSKCMSSRRVAAGMKEYLLVKSPTDVGDTPPNVGVGAIEQHVGWFQGSQLKQPLVGKC